MKPERFVLPQLVSDGVLSLLTIARGLAGDPANPPEFLDSASLLDVGGGVYVEDGTGFSASERGIHEPHWNEKGDEPWLSY